MQSYQIVSCTNNLLNYITAFRLQTQIMTVSALCVYFSYIGHFCIRYLPFIFSVISLHLAANSIAEYRDFISGVDDFKYDLPLRHLKNPRIIYYMGCICLIFGVFFGLIATYLSSFALFYVGVVAVLLTYFYSEKPLAYKYKCLSEVGVFLIFGPILFSACMIVSGHAITLKNIIFSFSIGFIVAAVMLANNIRDVDIDKKTRTIATVFGVRCAKIVFATLIITSFLLTLIYTNLKFAIFLLPFYPYKAKFSQTLLATAAICAVFVLYNVYKVFN